MATKQQVIDSHRAHPKWTASEIADKLQCSSEYVRATAKRNGLKLRKTINYSAPGTGVSALGQAARRAGLTLTDIEGIAARKQT